MQVEHHSPSSKSALLAAAKTLFAKNGYDGTSIKDLADYAGVNVSLVSYYFQGKEGLYQECLEQFGQARLAHAQRVLDKSSSREEFRVRLALFAEEVIECCLREQELVKLVQSECDRGCPVAFEVFRGTFLKIYLTLVEYFAAGQQQGWIRSDLDSQILGVSFFSTLVHNVQKDSAAKKFFGTSLEDPTYREKAIFHLVEVCLNGCQTPNGSPL